MGNVTSGRLLRFALLAACSPLSCVGNQTFDDGMDELRKRDARAPSAADPVDAAPPAPQSSGELPDAEATQNSAAEVPDAAHVSTPETNDELTSVLDAGATSASSATEAADADVIGTLDADVNLADASGPADAASAGGGRDLDAEVLGLTYAEGLFVAVGSNGAGSETRPSAAWLITSQDGRNWTQPPSTEQGVLRSVAHSQGRWVAVGWDVWQEGTERVDAHTVLISDDGLNWQPVQVAAFSQPQQVISVGEGFLLLDSDDASLWFSANGEEWIAQNSPGPVTWLATAEPWGPENERVVFAGRSDGQASLSLDLATTWSHEALAGAQISVDRLWVNALVVQGSGRDDSCTAEDASCLYLGRGPGTSTWWAQEKDTSQPFWPFNAVIDSVLGVEVATDGKRLAHRDSAVGEWLIVDEDDNQAARYSEIAFGQTPVSETTFVAAGAGGLRYSDDGEQWHRFESLAVE